MQGRLVTVKLRGFLPGAISAFSFSKWNHVAIETSDGLFVDCNRRPDPVGWWKSFDKCQAVGPWREMRIPPTVAYSDRMNLLTVLSYCGVGKVEEAQNLIAQGKHNCVSWVVAALGLPVNWALLTPSDLALQLEQVKDIPNL